MDSGVDILIGSLAKHIWTNLSPGASGCPNDVNGCDTTQAVKAVLGNGDVFPYTTTAYGQNCPGDDPSSPLASQDGVCGHGTHVSGIIAAEAGTGDGTGLGGVCPVCQIMPIKIIATINGSGAASDDAILNGFKYRFLHSQNSQALVRVANSSFGKYVRSRSVGLLVSILSQSPNEVLLIGAAGNEDSMLRSYPAAFSDAIAVGLGSPDGEGRVLNFGPWVGVAAPGGNASSDADTADQIQSTVPGQPGYGYKQGTSMACPVVAGVAALALSVYPTQSFQDLRNSIINTADPADYAFTVNSGINYNYYYPKLSGDPERRPLLGSGIVDAQAALSNNTTTGLLGRRWHEWIRDVASLGLRAGAEAGGGRCWLYCRRCFSPGAARGGISPRAAP